MKPPTAILAALLAGVLLGAGALHLSRSEGRPATAPETTRPDGRRIRFYQSPMHPWIRSDKPGRCTICGMELAPVHEGDAGIADDPNRVVLGTNAIQVLHVASVPVARIPVRRRIRLGGVVDDNDLRHRVVAAPVDARIERLGVRYLGQEFAAGELLAEIYSPTLLASEREYVALVQAGASAPLVSAVRQRLLQWGLLPDQVDALPRRDHGRFLSEIRTPAAGTVVSKRVYEGQYVKEGETLFETADFSTMWGQFEAYESDLPWIRKDLAVVVRVPSVPGHDFQGRVDLVDPTLDRMSRSARIRVELENPVVEAPEGSRRRLLHRVTANAEIEAVLEALSVPRSAVLRSGGPAIVFVDAGGGAYERREVRVGRVGDERIEVQDGLQEGEAVVVQGAFLLDAQTQLNRPDVHGGAEPSAGGRGSSSAPVPVALGSLLRAVGELADALAGGDAARADASLTEYGRLRRAALAEPGSPKDLVERLKGLPETPDPPRGRDVEGLRRWHVDLGAASGRLLGAMRRTGLPTEGFRLMQCPMTGKAFEGAPRKAYWIQTGPDVRNPYFGAAMLDCGTETREVP